jgi:hypothetical protein
MRLNFPVFSALSKRDDPFVIWSSAGVGVLLMLLVSCAGVSKSELTRAKTIAISKEQFAASPFGFDLTLPNFENRYYRKALKRQRYFIENVINSAQTDTIYHYYRRKTKILFYKPMHLEARIIGGTIRKPEVELRNGIRTGLSRKEFFWKFTDWVYDESDSLTIESPATGCTFTFIFKRDNIREIQIASKMMKNRN